MRVALVALALLLSTPAFAAEQIVRFYGGAHGIWYSGHLNLPDDFEVGGAARASLSPHISLVGSAWYGIDKSYLRGSAGGRVTISDATNPNFSIGVGLQYHVSSEPVVRPEEWAGDVSIGWRPWPVTSPRVVLVAQSTYGLSSEQISLLAGLRYSLGSTSPSPPPEENPQP